MKNQYKMSLGFMHNHTFVTCQYELQNGHKCNSPLEESNSVPLCYSHLNTTINREYALCDQGTIRRFFLAQDRRRSKTIKCNNFLGGQKLLIVAKQEQLLLDLNTQKRVLVTKKQKLADNQNLLMVFEERRLSLIKEARRAELVAKQNKSPFIYKLPVVDTDEEVSSSVEKKEKGVFGVREKKIPIVVEKKEKGIFHSSNEEKTFVAGEKRGLFDDVRENVENPVDTEEKVPTPFGSLFRPSNRTSFLAPPNKT